MCRYLTPDGAAAQPGWEDEVVEDENAGDESVGGENVGMKRSG